jgi:hypothetical protein
MKPFPFKLLAIALVVACIIPMAVNPVLESITFYSRDEKIVENEESKEFLTGNQVATSGTIAGNYAVKDVNASIARWIYSLDVTGAILSSPAPIYAKQKFPPVYTPTMSITGVGAPAFNMYYNYWNTINYKWTDFYIGGSRVLVTTRPSTYQYADTDTIASDFRTRYFTSTDVHPGYVTWTIPIDKFNGYYETNPDLASYTSNSIYVSAFIQLQKVGGGAIDAPCRRVASMKCLFEDTALLTTDYVSWNYDPSDGYFYLTKGLGRNYHAINFGFDTMIIGKSMEIQRFGGTDWISLDGGTGKNWKDDIMYLDGNADFAVSTPRINSYNLGYMSVSLRYKLSDLVSVSSSTHNVNGHTHNFYIATLPGVAYMSSGTFNLSAIVGSINYFGTGSFNEGFVINGTTGFDTVSRAYTFSETSALMNINLVRSGTNAISLSATITGTIRLPYSFSVSFTKIKTSLADITISDMEIQKSYTSTTVTISWKNLAYFGRVASTLTSYVTDSCNLRYELICDQATTNPTWLSGSPLAGWSKTTVTTCQYEAASFKTNINSNRLSVVLNRQSPGVTTYNFHLTLKRINEGGVQPPTKTFDFAYTLTQAVVSGSITDAWFESPDLAYKADFPRAVYDKDGAFVIRADVSGLSNVFSYSIPIFKDGVLRGTISKPHVGSLLTINVPVDFPSLGVSVLDPGDYNFYIIPCNIETTLNIEKTFGNDASENARFTDYRVGISVLVYTPPVISFNNGEPGGVIGGVAISSTTGLIGVTYVNYNTELGYSLSPGESLLEQRVGGTPSGSIVGFDDFQTVRTFPLSSEFTMSNIQKYPDQDDVTTILGRISSFEYEPGNFITLNNIWRVKDGTYTYDAFYSFEKYGYSQVSNFLTFNVVTKRTLATTTSTSYSGNIQLNWNHIHDSEPTPERYTENSNTFYVVLFGKQSDGITPSSFQSNLDALSTSSPNIKLLAKRDTTSSPWYLYTAKKSSGALSVSIDGDSELWGHFGGKDFDDDSAVYYFAVVPVYFASANIGNVAYNRWFHGEISNIVQVTISKQLFVSAGVFPSSIELIGDEFVRAIYTQDQFTVEATGLTSSSYADAATLKMRDIDREVDVSIDPISGTSGNFEWVIPIFDTFTFDTPTKNLEISIEFDFTSTLGIIEIYPKNPDPYRIITGLDSRLVLLSHYNRGVAKPGIDASLAVQFSIEATTDSDAVAKGLPIYSVDPSFISVDSISISGLMGSARGTMTILPVGSDDGTIDRVGGYTWELVINNLFSFSSNQFITFTVSAFIDDTFITIDVTGSFDLYVNHDPTLVLVSHSLPTNKILAFTSYIPITFEWISFFGAVINPSSVTLLVTRNGVLYFSGVLTPDISSVYRYTINPLQHGMQDHFEIAFVAEKDNGVAILRFFVHLDFKIFVTIDLNNPLYTSTNPTINGQVNAMIHVTYPVIYKYYYLDFDRVINKENYVMRRDLGGGTTLIFPLEDPLNLVDPTVAGVDMIAHLPSPSQVDNFTFLIQSPTLVKTGNQFIQGGKIYRENFTLSSQYSFDGLIVTLSPSYVGFPHNSTERWNVTVNGINTTFSIVGSNLVINVASILPGAVKKITIMHYYYTAPVPPQPPTPPSLLDQILQWFYSIIASILSIFGIGIIVIRRRRSLTS